MTLLTKPHALQRLEQHRQELLREGEGCMMCALVRGRSSPAPLDDSEHAVVVLNRFASRPGHVMVIAKRHVEHATELDWAAYARIQRHVYQASRAIQVALRPRRLFTAALGATVPLAMSYTHYHVHVIPVHETDEQARPAKVFSWSTGVVVYSEREAEDLRAQILGAWTGDD